MASKAVIDTLIAEAGGEGEDGLIAAAWAIQQRAAANGVSIDKVVRSGFDGFSNPGSGAKAAQNNPALRRRVEQIMSGVESGSIPNPVPGADHFLSGDVMPSWAKSMKLVATVGGHRFYASGKVPEDKQGNSVGTQLDTARPAPVPAKPSVVVTASRNRQNMTPAADVGASIRSDAGSFLTKDGRGVTSPVDYVLGPKMTTRLPQPVGQTYAGQERAPAVAARKPAAPSSVTVARSEQASARGAGTPARPVVTPPSSGKSASANVASARSEQAAARGLGNPARPVAKTAVEAITAAAVIPGPNSPPKTAPRLVSPALAFTTPSMKLPSAAELETATGFRVGSPLAIAGAVAPRVQSAAMIATRTPKKVAPVPALRMAAPAVVVRKPVVTPVSVARTAVAVAAAAQSGGSGSGSSGSSDKVKGHSASGGMRYDPDTAQWGRA